MNSPKVFQDMRPQRCIILLQGANGRPYVFETTMTEAFEIEDDSARNYDPSFTNMYVSSSYGSLADRATTIRISCRGYVRPPAYAEADIWELGIQGLAETHDLDLDDDDDDD